MFLLLIIGLLVMLGLVQLIRLALSDCDLSLQWAEKFGHSPKFLRGQVVWVTGASSGIGEALAYRLAAAGCHLVLSARRTLELERVKKQCLLSGPLEAQDVLVLTIDMLQFETHAAAVETVINHFGQIDILVNNAGRSQRATWVKTSLEVDRQMLELNVLGVLSLTKCVLPHMMQRKSGHVVVVSSVAGKIGAPFSGSYTGSKHALHGWFETLRVEAAEDHIDVTMVCPGPVFSQLLNVAFTENPHEMYTEGMKSGEKRMATDRCAELIAVAIANRLDEVWISLHPVLAILYLGQYAPTLLRKYVSE